MIVSLLLAFVPSAVEGRTHETVSTLLDKNGQGFGYE